MNKYTFICKSSDGLTMKEVDIPSDTWQQPVEEFFTFLKGCGFCFEMDETLTVYNLETGNAR